MSKLKWNFIIDVFLFLLLTAIGGIGFLMSFLLIPGSETWEKYGTKVDLTFLGLDRHQWGDIHLILGFIFLGLMALHIILHWKLIIDLYAKLIKNRNLRRILGTFFVASCLLLLLFFLVINPVVTEGIRHQRLKTPQGIEPDNIIIPDKPIEKKKIQSYSQEDSQSPKEKHDKRQDPKFDVRGFMTLQEVASEYNIPIDYLKRKLQLPPETSNDENLGRLRKIYSNFKMSDVEKIIVEYKKEKKRK